ncbi:zeta toxin family protein [Streptomyces sp. NPDC058001]|uniref:zeta toxin family protein n=1 Tax=Streptomyces sp. NPDC058001 TaxID=3346300 RepID=UPI0036EC7FA8
MAIKSSGALCMAGMSCPSGMRPLCSLPLGEGQLPARVTVSLRWGWPAPVRRRRSAAGGGASGQPAREERPHAAYRQADYRVGIVALAVPEAVSRLGILDRYLRLAGEGRARYVSWDNHDACAAALTGTLAAVGNPRLGDRVVVVRRSTGAPMDAVYAKELGDGRWRRPAGAARAVLTERAGPWGPGETGRFRRQLAGADRRLADPALPEDWSLAVRRDAERAAAWGTGVVPSGVRSAADLRTVRRAPCVREDLISVTS